MPVYEVLLNTELQIHFVQISSRPSLERRITIAIDKNVLCFLTRAMVYKGNEGSYIYDWHIDGSLTHLHCLLNSPYDSESKALEAVLQLGFKIYIFDTLGEMIKFVANWKK